MRKIQTTLTVVAITLMTQTLWGQQTGQQTGQPIDSSAVPAKTGDITETTEAVASTVMSSIRQAASGDTTALQDLAARFLLPAIIALGVLVIGYLVASFFGRTIGGTLTRRVDATLGKFMGRAIKNAILFLVLLGVLGYFGVDVTSFAAILAAMGFAIGMALQGTLANFAAGIMLLAFRPFKVDDYIQVGGEEGRVEEIDLFTTRLNTKDNLHKIIPNGQIFGATITNFSRNQVRRADVNVGADYAADIDYTRAVLQASISEIPGAVLDPPPQVVLTELADSSVSWQLRAWCQPVDYANVRELLMVAAKKGMDLNGIGIPFPQMEIHLPDQKPVDHKKPVELKKAG